MTQRDAGGGDARRKLAHVAREDESTHLNENEKVLSSLLYVYLYHFYESLLYVCITSISVYYTSGRTSVHAHASGHMAASST